MPNKKQKEWRLLPKVSDDYVVKHSDKALVVLQMLHNRGFIRKEEINNLLNSNYEDHAYDPFLFNDMHASVKLVIEHIKKQNEIVVFGDYDADGVTSSALLVDLLQILKAKVGVYIPDRVSEGYGVNKTALKYLINKGVKLIITVDNGIKSKEEIAYAQKNGVDIIVTDHHPIPNEDNLPDCLVINPILECEKYPYKKLAGVGVAFKFAKAILSESKLKNDQKIMLEKRMLDMVAIGTVADCVPLLGENRVLVKEGLKAIDATRRAGLIELKKVAGLDSKKIVGWNIGFQLAPRINAAGRMDHANTAYELMTTKDDGQAVKLAQELNSRNIERQMETANIFLEVDEQVKDCDDKILIGIFDLDKDKESRVWNEGIIGLVAGRICEKYYKPTLVITKADNGYKGSGRSIEEFNLAEAIEESSEFLDKHGGHPMACGLSLSADKIDDFKKCVTNIANKKLSKTKLVPKINIEMNLDIREINEALITEIDKFEPFGQGNEKPKFSSLDVEIVDKMLLGTEAQHLKLKLKQDDSDIMVALGFSQADKWSELREGDKIDIAYYLDINEFNGRRSVQMKILDIKLKNQS